MSKRLIRVDLTPAQLLCVNAALALLEADAEDEEARFEGMAVMIRTRRKVWDAMIKWGVKP